MTTYADEPIGVAVFVDADDVEVLIDPEMLVPCPACEGHGEIYVSGDPRADNLETRSCTGCQGDGEVTLLDADVTRMWMEAEYPF